MKRKTLWISLIVMIFASRSTVFAQNEEYFRPDSLNKASGETKDVPPVVAQKPLGPRQSASLDRLRAGGSFGLSLGTFTNISVSPMVGYEFTEKLVGGIGITGMYFNSQFSGVKAWYYGQRTLLMYNILPSVNLVGELEFLNVETDTFTKYNVRKWIASPMLGLAYSQPLGGRLVKGVHLALLYNFNYNNQVDDYGVNISPYGRLFNQPLLIRVTFL
jgi:hypothetical protein